MKLHQGPVFIDGEFNRGRSSLQDEFCEGRPKSVVVAETIDAVHQLMLHDRHVNYREIETTLGISGTSIHSILHVKNQSIRVAEVLRQLVQKHAKVYRS